MQKKDRKENEVTSLLKLPSSPKGGDNAKRTLFGGKEAVEKEKAKELDESRKKEQTVVMEGVEGSLEKDAGASRSKKVGT